MNYTKNNIKNQELIRDCLIIPSTLKGFINTETQYEDNAVYYKGYIPLESKDCICPNCSSATVINNTYEVKIKHIPIGKVQSIILLDKKQFQCPNCGHTYYQEIPFKSPNHFISNELKTYITDLLKTNYFTNKEISYLTGVNRNIIKEIDMERLKQKYTKDGKGKELILPETTAEYLGIDEFKLHNGYKYATHIINYKTGNIIWIAAGKKKEVVYNFINHVGLEWMSNVKAVACDMNSDFEEAFKEKCPHLKIVYDHFHIVKYLNEKVINPIRIEEQKRLEEAGDKEGAKRLKRTKMVLTSSTETLKKKDEDAKNEKVLNKGSELFKTSTIIRRGNYYNRYVELVNNNELFLTIELIKATLSEAYLAKNEDEMVRLIFDILELCEATDNKYIKKFGNLIYNHFDGIISYATYNISSGKIEGINNKIKTLRRQAYGYPDDEYFFLKLMDMSRN